MPRGSIDSASVPISTFECATKTRKKYVTKHMKAFPELFRSDVSIHPSYTNLKNLPYNVICRRRLKKLKKLIIRQLDREITHFAMMQLLALDAVRIDRFFGVGLAPRRLIVPDFATDRQRRRINDLLER